MEFDDSDATGDVSGVSESESGTTDLDSNVDEYSFDVQSTSSEKSVTAELDPLKTARAQLLLGCDVFFCIMFLSQLLHLQIGKHSLDAAIPFYQLHPQGMMSSGGGTIFASRMRSAITWKTGAMR